MSYNPFTDGIDIPGFVEWAGDVTGLGDMFKPDKVNNLNSAGTKNAYKALQNYSQGADQRYNALANNANLYTQGPGNVNAQAVNGLGQYAGFAGNAARGAQNAASYGQNVAAGFRPDAGLQAFMSYSPQMQHMAMGQYSPLQQGLNAQAADQSRLAMQNAAGQFANQGALHSGAAMAAMGEAAARPFADVQNQLGMAQTQQNAALQQQLMGQTGQNAQLGAQLGMQAGQLGLDAAGQQANTFQNLAGLDLSRLQGNQQAQLQAAQGNQTAAQNAQLANQQAVLQQLGLQNALQGQVLGGYTGLGEQALQQQGSQFQSFLNNIIPLLGAGNMAGLI